jgi:hypothetical protein
LDWEKLVEYRIRSGMRIRKRCWGGVGGGGLEKENEEEIGKTRIGGWGSGESEFVSE